MLLLIVIAVVLFVVVMAVKSKPAKKQTVPKETAGLVEVKVPAAKSESELDPRWTDVPEAPENGMHPDDYLAALKAQQEEREARKAHYKFAVLDFETTGFDGEEDDILQVAIIDDKGEVLMNQLCKPVQVEAWPEAAEVNNIYPRDVAFCPTFEQIAPYVQDVLSRATKIVAYNTSFEKEFLEGHSIDPKQFKWARDPMKTAAQYYNVQRGTSRYSVKLSVIAKMVGFKYKAHDALEDVKATRYVYLFLQDWVKRQRAEAKVSTVDTK